MRLVTRQTETRYYQDEDCDGNLYDVPYEVEVLSAWVDDTLVFQGTEDEAYSSYREAGATWLPSNDNKKPALLADAVLCFTEDLAVETSGKVNIYRDPPQHIYMVGDSRPVEVVKGRKNIQIVLPDHGDSSPDHYEWLTGLHLGKEVLLHNCYLSTVNGNMDAEFTATHVFH